jgi:hypothetical protein
MLSRQLATDPLDCEVEVAQSVEVRLVWQLFAQVLRVRKVDFDNLLK